MSPDMSGQIILQLTGSKTQDSLTWVRYLEALDGFWRVSKHDKEVYLPSQQPECLFTLSGVDLYTQEQAGPHHASLINEYLILKGRGPA
jgi:hypothetical protein